MLGKRVRGKTVGTRANAAMATVTTTASHGLVAGAQATTPPADDGACAMELDEPKRDRLAEEIILAAYRKDAATVASCLKRCSASATADACDSRAVSIAFDASDAARFATASAAVASDNARLASGSAVRVTRSYAETSGASA